MSCAPFHAISASARGLRFFPNWMADIWAPYMRTKAQLDFGVEIGLAFWNFILSCFQFHADTHYWGVLWIPQLTIVFLNQGFPSFDISLNVCIATGRSGWERLEWTRLNSTTNNKETWSCRNVEWIRDCIWQWKWYVTVSERLQTPLCHWTALCLWQSVGRRNEHVTSR